MEKRKSSDPLNLILGSHLYTQDANRSDGIKQFGSMKKTNTSVNVE